ncbi:flavodoxin family protein [Halobacillus salinus]|uniref:Flavodoxin family protein n=1 Tax=Halobacillus salinus TaxID=192814 RepID=A0A4Z0H738_9BACI|nr:flavodoxin family protein [Halobacillus salinus]TGB04906.1 flavodoxin family protein [Halobacillus salinus]
MKIAILDGGGRRDGNTQTLTERVVDGIEVSRFGLKEYDIHAISDERHEEDGFHAVDDDYDALMTEVMKHDVILFATPIYWYSMTATMKGFIDRWSQSMRQPKFADFREQMAEKKAFVVAVGGDNPYVKGLPMIQQFANIFEFVHLPFEGYILGKAHRPGDILDDESALYAADRLHQKLKEWTS